MKNLLLIAAFLLPAHFAWAGNCTLMVNRICQPGKACRTSETHTQLVNSANDCLSLAQRMCPVYFSEGVAGKQVRAQFDGAPLNGGQNLCQ